MTLAHVPLIAACLWLATAFWHIAVALVTLRSSFRRAYPAFSSFACISAAVVVTLMVLPPELYFLGYTIGSTAISLLIGAALFELYLRVCGPHFSLPAWVPRTMALWLTLAIVVSVAVTCSLYTVHSLPRRAALMTVGQGGMLTALLLALVVLVAYSTHLRMLWKARPKQIAVGLAIYLSVNAVVLFLVNHVPQDSMALLDRTAQVAGLISLIWWTFTLRRREPPRQQVTPEMMETILAFHRETMEAAESIGLIRR